MPSTYSPLRYPGGKTRMYGYVKELLKCNDLLGGTYIEPFAGGAGLALKLLMNGDVERIVINDSDKAIYYFWFSILYLPDKFREMIITTPVTVEEWHKQRAIYRANTEITDIPDPLRLGFAVFFLNRVNVSGVVKGGVIGGLKQERKYKLDARFNKETLIKKISRIAEYKERILLLGIDAVDFLCLLSYTKKKHPRSFVYLDPPYVAKGAQLYENAFTEQDHKELREVLTKCDTKWVLTYDIHPLIDELYKGYRRSYLDMTYSIQRSRKAREYIFFSDNMILPDGIELQEA